MPLIPLPWGGRDNARAVSSSCTKTKPHSVFLGDGGEFTVCVININEAKEKTKAKSTTTPSKTHFFQSCPRWDSKPMTLHCRHALYQMRYQLVGILNTTANLKPLCYGTVHSHSACIYEMVLKALLHHNPKDVRSNNFFLLGHASHEQ